MVFLTCPSASSPQTAPWDFSCAMTSLSMKPENSSRSFSTTLPVKPSVTTTSAAFWKISPPSMLPTNGRPEASSIAWASWSSSVPFWASSPMFSSPIRGSVVPRQRLM